MVAGTMRDAVPAGRENTLADQVGIWLAKDLPSFADEAQRDHHEQQRQQQLERSPPAVITAR